MSEAAKRLEQIDHLVIARSSKQSPDECSYVRDNLHKLLTALRDTSANTGDWFQQVLNELEYHGTIGPGLEGQPYSGSREFAKNLLNTIPPGCALDPKACFDAFLNLHDQLVKESK